MHPAPLQRFLRRADIMSTLVYDPFYRDMHSFFGFESLKDMMKEKHPTRWLEFERGHIDESKFLEDYFKDGRDYDKEGFRQHVKSCYRFLDGIEELLQELKDAGVEMHACSNYPSWWEMIEERLALSRFLSWSFVSCKTGVRKPERAAFERALELAGAPPPGAVLFVDDCGENVEAARAAGMHALRFTDAASLRAALVAHGLLPAAPAPAPPEPAS
eukprot:tig00021126_g18470.t1